jgi:hypothetical protein
MILGREMGREEAYGGQIHRAILEAVEQNWELQGHSGGLDAPVGGVLGKMEGLCAVGEQ